MSRFCPLYSSSKGNGIFLSGGGTCLLIDAGVSYRSLAASLDGQGYAPADLSAVLVTHEHTDHVRGLKTLLARAKIPLYASRGTLEYLWLNDYIPSGAKVFECDGEFTVGDIAVRPFSTPHDAAKSLGYRFTMPDMRTVAVATDLGHIAEEVRANLLGCDLVMLESNYDINMLECSSYPYPLKRRIRSDFGHLSNEACAAFLPELVQNGATRLVLGHLSEQNNVPELARETALAPLALANMREGLDFTLHVAPARGKTQAVVF